MQRPLAAHRGFSRTTPRNCPDPRQALLRQPRDPATPSRQPVESTLEHVVRRVDTPIRQVGLPATRLLKLPSLAADIADWLLAGLVREGLSLRQMRREIRCRERSSVSCGHEKTPTVEIGVWWLVRHGPLSSQR